MAYINYTFLSGVPWGRIFFSAPKFDLDRLITRTTKNYYFQKKKKLTFDLGRLITRIAQIYYFQKKKKKHLQLRPWLATHWPNPDEE